jgi:hypothetical protein
MTTRIGKKSGRILAKRSLARYASSAARTRRAGRSSRSASSSASASIPKRTGPLAAVAAVVAWLRLGEPIPDGWRLAAQRLTHHHRYSVLIEKVTP